MLRGLRKWNQDQARNKIGEFGAGHVDTHRGAKHDSKSEPLEHKTQERGLTPRRNQNTNALPNRSKGGKGKHGGRRPKKIDDGELEKTTPGAVMKLFAQIRKVDEEKRLVYGRAVQEVVDRVGEIFDYTTSKPHFEAWSKSFAEATDGKSQGNIRAMHGKVSAGIVKEIQFDDTSKAIDIAAHINDDQEWRKVLDGNYTGFSIGGSYVGERITEKIDDGKGGHQEIKRYTANPSEISIVDSPCIPTARFFEVVKADGKIEKVDFKPAAIEVKGTDAQVSDFGDALNMSGFSLGDAIDFVRDASMLDTIESLEKREFSSDERKSAAKQGQALPDGSFPIKSVSDLHNAVRAYGRAKNKAAAKAHIIKRAKALGAMDAIPDAWKKDNGEKMEDGTIKKGLWNVSRFAECLECLAQICESAQMDFDVEGDDSPVPMKLRNEVEDLIECFKEMADEESAEMLEELKEKAGVGEDDEIESGIELAFHLGSLTKRLNDPELPIVELAKIATEYEEPLTTAVLADMPGLRKRIIAKAGARHSKVDQDHLQMAHDHLVGMGADCYGEKGQASGDLVKAATQTQEDLTNALKRIAALEAQPMPHVVTLRVAKKGEPVTEPTDELTKLAYADCVKNPDGTVNWEATRQKLGAAA